MPKTPVTLLEIEKYAHVALRRWLTRALRVPEVKKRSGIVKASAVMVDLKICGLAKMVRFNSSFRGKPRPTDVLSFEAPDVFKQQGVLGDLLICGPVAVKQADELGHAWKSEIDVLLVHGILHLCGYDHEKSVKEAKEMALLEKKVLGVKNGRGLIGR